jgi:hypothetical protein
LVRGEREAFGLHGRSAEQRIALGSRAPHSAQGCRLPSVVCRWRTRTRLPSR